MFQEMLLILSMQNSVLLSYLKSKPSKMPFNSSVSSFLIFPLIALINSFAEPSNHSSNISPAFSFL
ncbi:hypothetical protein HMPREF0369_02667 [Anaerostipes hadrus ATCC 29173 = JCM 17467]|nr:hypothetical protein HMPREF0369_02667 [Anaerostipes hadrus ATCC 29173 = JCM 17467]